MKSKVIRLLLSLALALGIWLYVVTVVSPESEITIHQIPVLLESEDVLAERNLIIVSNKHFTVDLKLIGNRVDLNKLSSSNITVMADLSQITEPGEHNIRYSVAYPNIVDGNNIDTLEKNPQHITLSVVERDWKEVPVKVDYGNSRVPDGYLVDRQNPKLSHTTITVSGPKTTLENLHHAKIQVNLNGMVSTIVDSFRLILCDKNGDPLEEDPQIPYVDKITMDVSTVTATVEIYKIKEIPLVMEVVPGGGLTENDVTLHQSLQTLIVTGSDEILEKLDQIVVGQICLAEVEESGILTYDIVMPSGVRNVTGVTKMTVDVTLLQQLQTKTFTIDTKKIQLVNKPDNRHIKLVNQFITITVRGTEAALANLKEEDILMVLDCSDAANLNNMTVPMNVTVEIAEDAGCGSVGVYQVIVEVTEIASGG